MNANVVVFVSCYQAHEHRFLRGAGGDSGECMDLLKAYLDLNSLYSFFTD